MKVALTRLLSALDSRGPFVRPVLSLTEGAARRGQAYTRAIEAGLIAFWTRYRRTDRTQQTALQSRSTARPPTAKQLLDDAKTRTSEAHPAGSVKQLDVILPLGLALGLLWTDTEQLNEARQREISAPHVVSFLST